MAGLFVLLVCVAILVGGILAAVVRNPLVAAICAGACGLFASLAFVLLGAPDVAMAEAAIGSGLGIFVFLYTLKKVGYSGRRDK